MTYEEFVPEFKDALREYFPNRSLDIREITVTKVNETYQGLTVRMDGSAKAPTFPIDKIYEEYKNGIPMEILADRTAKTLTRTMDYEANIPEFSMEEAKKSIRATVINADMNVELLEKCPHEKITGTDLAVTPRWYLPENASFLVTDAVASELHLTKEEVIQIAKENTRNTGYTFNDIESVLSGILNNNDVSDEYINEIVPQEKSFMYVVSNPSGVDGASVMVNADAMKEIGQRLGENYTILPSSRHEILVVPDSQSVSGSYLKDMVKDINQQEVEPRDRLSDNVYHYNRLTQQISMCDQNGFFHDNNRLDSGQDNGGREGIKVKGGIRL